MTDRVLAILVHEIVGKMDKEEEKAVAEDPCPVCRDSMGGKRARKSSYGGICCLSCRAFFRRANQVT